MLHPDLHSEDKEENLRRVTSSSVTEFKTWVVPPFLAQVLNVTRVYGFSLSWFSIANINQSFLLLALNIIVLVSFFHNLHEEL